MDDDHTPIDKSWRKRYLRAEKLCMIGLRVVCFAGIIACLFGLQSYLGSLMFASFWLSLDSSLSKPMRVAGGIGLFSVILTVFILPWLDMGYAVAEVHTYRADDMDALGSTSIEVHTSTLHRARIYGSRRFYRFRDSGPHEIWLAISDDTLRAPDLVVVGAVLITSEGNIPVEFERSTTPKVFDTRNPFETFQSKANTIAWRQVSPLDLGKYGTSVQLRVTVKRGAEQLEFETTLSEASFLDAGLIYRPD